MVGRRLLAFAVAAVAAVALGALAPAAAPAPTLGHAVAGSSAHRVADLEQTLLAAINGLRQAHGLVPLKRSEPLGRAAAAHSEQMGADGYFAHESADGSPFWRRVERYYPSTRWDYWSVGENLLWASPEVDAQRALQMWLDSPKHRANLLAARWREVGLSALAVPAAPGPYQGLDVTILTADFGVRR